jgi:hypothetical protein
VVVVVVILAPTTTTMVATELGATKMVSKYKAPMVEPGGLEVFFHYLNPLWLVTGPVIVVQAEAAQHQAAVARAAEEEEEEEDLKTAMNYKAATLVVVGVVGQPVVMVPTALSH